MMNNEVIQVNEKLLSYNDIKERTLYVVVGDLRTEVFYIKSPDRDKNKPLGVMLDNESVLSCYWPEDKNEKMFRKAQPHEFITIRNSQ